MIFFSKEKHRFWGGPHPYPLKNTFQILALKRIYPDNLQQMVNLGLNTFDTWALYQLKHDFLCIRALFTKSHNTVMQQQQLPSMFLQDILIQGKTVVLGGEAGL